MLTDLGTLKIRRAEQLVTLWILSRRTWGEPARRALQYSSLERTREKTRRRWPQKKNTVGLNRSAWFPGKQVDRVCSPVPRMQAGCQKLHQGYELYWKMGCHSDPHAVKMENQFQVQSLSEDLFCSHLTEVYSELSRLYIWNAGFDGPCESECFRRRIRFVQFSIIRKHVMIDSGTNYTRKRLRIQNEKNWSQDRVLGDPTRQKRRVGFNGEDFPFLEYYRTNEDVWICRHGWCFGWGWESPSLDFASLSGPTSRRKYWKNVSSPCLDRDSNTR